MKRKIVRVGASLCILLPKSVVTAMDWDFDDYIDLILDESDETVYFRNMKKKKKKVKSYIENFSEFQKEYADILKEIETKE
jgi:antitoxin component of MazEF toxin-antitoxin module